MRGAMTLRQSDKSALYSDTSYAGTVVPADELSRFADVDYYRQKILEFQAQMNALAATADQVLALRDQVTDTGLQADLDAWLSDFYSRKPALQLAAEGVNAAAATSNALGVRMPVVSLPQQLSAFPPAVIAAVAAAAAGVAWAIAYAVSAISSARSIIARKETLALLPEDERAKALQADQNIQLAQQNASSVIGTVAGLVKWLAIGVAVYFGWRAYQEFRR